MSTRCQIGVYEYKEQKIAEPTALIYRHSDGYPGKADGSESGVLADVIPFVCQFKSARGNDPEYLAARLLQHLCNKYDEAMGGRDGGARHAGLLGHGICKMFHGDIEYYYAIRPDSLSVYEVEFGTDPGSWKIVDVIEL